MISLHSKSIKSIFIFIILTFNQCVEVIDFTIEETPDQLVIIGSIDTQPGPYIVTISMTTPYSQIDYGVGNEVTDASVTLSSDDGQVEELTNARDGTYYTNAEGIRGEIGKSYTLTVITADDKVYQSSSELIIASPQIDSVYFEYDEKEILFNGIEKIEKYANLAVDFQDDPIDENYYSWSWKGTYRFESNPELFVSQTGTVPIITPLPCSFNGCSCCTCWVSTPETNELALLSDQLNNGQKVIGQKIGTVPINGNSFQYKYYVEVTQKSLSPKAYNFWKLIKDQETASSITSTPPAQIKGNIININEPSELVWGFFSASDLSKSSFFIEPKDIPNFSAIPSDTIKNDCIVIEGATRQEPIFWR